MLDNVVRNYLFELLKLSGKKSDDYSIDTMYGLLQAINLHNHGICYVYPNRADGIVVTGGATAWLQGAMTQIIPAYTITNHFDIHWVSAYNASATDSYQLDLYRGSTGQEVSIASIPIVRDTNVSTIAPIKVMTPIIEPNTKISAKLSSKSGGNDTLTVKLQYHIY